MRVEADVVGAAPAGVELVHGLPGALEVAAERVSPAVLLLRIVGGVRLRDATPTAAPDGATVNPAELRVSIDKRLDIEGINTPTAKDIDIHREGDGWVAIADYEEVAPLFGNVSLLLQFHKQVKLQ